jgi:hypothetical protein
VGDFHTVTRQSDAHNCLKLSKKEEAQRQAEAADKRLKALENHYTWLAAAGLKKPDKEQLFEPSRVRCIDPASPEGRRIVHELNARYSELTAPSSLAA